MTKLALTVTGKDGQSNLTLDLARTFNLGFTMRDAAKMREHLDEVVALGVPVVVSDNPPMVSPVSNWITITDTDVTVQGPKTSGEVEIVTIQDESGHIFVGVGSDHTDRALEVIDIPWSKQVAPNVIAPEVWRWEEVEPHWNDVQMECVVGVGGVESLYQQASVSEFWTPLEMLEGLRRKIVPTRGTIALFSGTVVSLGNEIIFGDSWTIRMIDPVLKRTIEHTYTVTVLNTEIIDNGLTS